jgi:hypothetical protein
LMEINGNRLILPERLGSHNLSIYFNSFQPISTYFNSFQPISTQFNLFQPISSSTQVIRLLKKSASADD